MAIVLRRISRALPGKDIPGFAVTNEQLAALVNEYGTQQIPGFAPLDPDFPLKRIGVKSRLVLDSALKTSDLALKVAEKLKADISRVRAIVVTTVTAEATVPSIASMVQAALGARAAVSCFDLPIGCNGFIAGLKLVKVLLEAEPEGSTGILIGAEAMSRVLDATDRQTSVIFGDAAAGVLMEKVKVARATPNEVGEVEWLTKGEKGHLIEIVPAGRPVVRLRASGHQLSLATDAGHSLRVRMDGQRVFRDMVAGLPTQVRAYVAKQRRTLQDYDHFVFHQANRRILEAVVRALGLPEEKALCNLAMLGNTTSASIPLVLADLVRPDGILPRTLLVGFGAGYSVGIAEVGDF